MTIVVTEAINRTNAIEWKNAEQGKAYRSADRGTVRTGIKTLKGEFFCISTNCQSTIIFNTWVPGTNSLWVEVDLTIQVRPHE